uniref:immunoglobulin omega chain-like n=1 Tax=Odobenus rosmarus divergens TaxID=9708 RepID=UPI00063CA946|nr:PREDICTED: immunoglobulin omega chain-like [Odobenus rosmarus divergens]
MDWTPLLLLILSQCTGSLSQPVLTLPPSVSASPGTMVRLTCTLSRDIGVGGPNIDWIQRQPGSPPRDLLYYSSDSDKHQGSGVPSCSLGSKDASANAGLLRISGLQAEAEADYYCSIWDRSSSSHTALRTHEDVRQKPPYPVLIRPPSLSASLGTTARLTCTLSRDISVGGSNIWIQQQPGSPPRDLLYYSSDSHKHQGPGVPSRFSGSKVASANAGLCSSRGCSLR